MSKNNWLFAILALPLALGILWVIAILSLVMSAHFVGPEQSEALLKLAVYVMKGPLEWITH